MISVTDKAKQRIVALRQEEGYNQAHNIRVSVKGGGCSGLMYDLNFDATINPSDEIFEIISLPSKPFPPVMIIILSFNLFIMQTSF